MSPSIILARLFGKLGSVFFRLSRKLYAPTEPIQAQRVIPWFKDKGDQTLRLNYLLNADSVVFDMGGYEGQWASDIFSMYGCYIHVFEPVKEFADNIRSRFKHNDKITVHQFGLAEANKTLDLSLEENSSSTFKSNGVTIKISLKPAMDFIKENSITKIDLIKINIEGGEYDLLESLIEDGFIKNITNIQVQFHDFVPDAETRMKAIQDNLQKTHRLTYQYIFVWENWELKQPK